METLRGATSPVYGNVEGCSITHQYMEKLRGVIYHQYMETVRCATSPTSIRKR
jgi:hypothetical protein